MWRAGSLFVGIRAVTSYRHVRACAQLSRPWADHRDMAGMPWNTGFYLRRLKHAHRNERHCLRRAQMDFRYMRVVLS